MPDEVCTVSYAYVVVKNQPGEGAKVANALKEANVNLLALSGFPVGKTKAQVDLVTQDVDGLKRVAKANKWKLSSVKKALLVQGEDRVGAVADIVSKLAGAKINIISVQAVAAGAGRYGAIVWVKPASFAKAAKVLGAK